MAVFFVRILFLVLFLFSSFPIFSESHRVKGKHSLIELIQLVSDQKTTLILKIKPNDGWHIYWLNPGDSGSALTVDWDNPPTQILNTTWSWPTPERIITGDIVNFGYHSEAILSWDAKEELSRDRMNTKTISGNFQWMVCREECIPESAYLKAKTYFQEDNDYTSIAKEIFDSIEKTHPKKIPNDWKASFQEKSDRFRLLLEISDSDSKSSSSIEFFPVDGEKLSGKTPNIRKNNENTWEIDIIKSEYYSGENVELLDAVVQLGEESYLVTFTKENSYFFFQALAFAFLGGLLLNLMPCVFPILTMKAMSVVQSSGMKDAEKRKDSLFYSMGVVGFFLLLYLVFLGLKMGGNNLGWGFQLQNPIFVYLLILLFVFMGLQMLGWIEFTVGVKGNLANITERKGFWGSFFSGAVAVIVATPCTAPFMGTAMAYAFSESAWVGLVVFTSLGLGMALPIVMIQNSRLVARIIPKPGNWMITFKEFLSFPLFLTSIWLLWILSAIVERNELFFSLGGIVFIIMLIWWFKKLNNVKLKTLVASLIIASTFAFSMSFSGKDIMPLPKIDPLENTYNDLENGNFGFKHATTYTPQNLKKILESDSPVFFYFTADWCVTCKYNEKTVFKREDVEDYFRENKIKVIKADWTNEDESITLALESFGRNGVPLYVFYPAQNRNSPKILPQMLTKNILESEIKL